MTTSKVPSAETGRRVAVPDSEWICPWDVIVSQKSNGAGRVYFFPRWDGALKLILSQTRRGVSIVHLFETPGRVLSAPLTSPALFKKIGAGTLVDADIRPLVGEIYMTVLEAVSWVDAVRGAAGAVKH